MTTRADPPPAPARRQRGDRPESKPAPSPPPAGRLPPAPTCQVDFSRPLDFTFLGRPVRGFAGDTVASALFAAGTRIFGRSLKYHRPRGLYSIEGESANTLMAIDGAPNECAETTELRAGMSVRAQNVRGNPATDRFAFLNLLDRLMPAGFYYRRFHRPRRLWPLHQKAIRRMAGTGSLDPNGEYGKGVRAELHLNADVAVVGGGASGMSAALAAADLGLRVCLFDRRPWLGGSMAWRTREFDGEPLHRRGEAMAERVAAAENVGVLTRSPVTGVWGDNLVTGFTIGADPDPFRERHWECRAKTVIVATGCMDRPLVFNHNDRPGVMQAGAARRLARTYAVKPGEQAVFSVADDTGLEAALDLANLGVWIEAVGDAREAAAQDPALVAALEERGIPVLEGWAASRALGGRRIRGCELRPVKGSGASHFQCDLLVANAGLQPRIGALATAGARFAYCPRTHSYQPVELPPGVFAAGSMTGLRDPRSVEASGTVAGLSAADAAASTLRAARRRAESLPGPAAGCGIAHGPEIGRGAKAFIDLDEDGTFKNAVECAAQGFDVPELAKRFGGFGLGPGQHRVAGQNLAMIMAGLRGEGPEKALPTTIRPPLAPPSLATLAGPGRDVHKRTPLHDELAARGASFRRAGPWLRARHFGGDPSAREEILNVRRNVGALDSSSLGKFRIHGPDALRALQRVYISDVRRAGRGRCLYSAMCNDLGQLVDDGIVVMDGEGDYYFTTSTARAGSTVEWLRFHTRHDGWDYNIVNLTDALGSINIAGPNARKLLQRVTSDDVSNEALPYLGCRRLAIGGPSGGDGGGGGGRGGGPFSARCLRLGFVGELSFELHVPSSHCLALWKMLMKAGADLGVRPFGLEAQYCLRAEKGHVIVGAESEQRVALTDIGMGWLWNRDDAMSKKVGATALRACERQPGRLKLAGFRVDGEPGADGPRDGALVVSPDGGIVGHVCTTRFSETLGWQYGMALVRDGHAAKGAAIVIQQEERPGRRATFSATVTPPPFYDPAGERMRA